VAGACLVAFAAGCGGDSDDGGDAPASTVPADTVAETGPEIAARENEVLDCGKKIDGIDVALTADWDADGGVVFTADELEGSMVLLLYADEEAAKARLDEMHGFYDNVQVHESEVIARQGEFDPQVLTQMTACL
jgi:hypothetical protein